MPIPPAVIELIERFSRNSGVYKSGVYNETQVRSDGRPRPADVGPAQATGRGDTSPQRRAAATADRRHGSPDRPAGLRIVWAERRGDSDCGGAGVS